MKGFIDDIFISTVKNSAKPHNNGNISEDSFSKCFLYVNELLSETVSQSLIVQTSTSSRWDELKYVFFKKKYLQGSILLRPT